MLNGTKTVNQRVWFSRGNLERLGASYLLNKPEFWSVLQYSAITGEFFTSSQILAEFFNQSRSDTVLANEGPCMDRTCERKVLQMHLSYIWRRKRRQRQRLKTVHMLPWCGTQTLQNRLHTNFSYEDTY